MNKSLVTLLLFFISINLYCQDTEVKGILNDMEGDPVPNARYYLKSSPGQKFRTTVKGEFSVKQEIEPNDELIFHAFGFDSLKVTITEKMLKRASKKDGIIELSLIMPDKQLSIFTVYPTRPDTLHGTAAYSIEDYQFLPNGNMILLTYEKNLKRGSILRLLDEQNLELDQYYIDVNDPGLELKRDFRGNIHMLTEERVFLIKVFEGKLRLYLEDRDYYFRYVAPVIDTIQDKIYFSNYSEVYPAFEYFEYCLTDSSYNKILKLEDSEMMEFYRAEFKYVDVRTKLWAHEMQLQTGIDKEIWVGATVFTNSIYYQPIYAPLFKTADDTLVVFDHYKNLMFRYNPTAGFTDSVHISYHKESRRSGWEQPLLQDRVTGKVYAMFEKSGYTYLSEIDQVTGEIRESYKLYFKYVERIQIVDGAVYYIYRPFESIQKKYIYRESLKKKE